ncbi:MAG: PBP1A family penicillin-binding protein [Pseudomonadota bacterium]
MLIILLSLAGIAGWVWLDRTILSGLPTDLSAFRDYRPPTACRVFDHEGAQVDEFYVERRIWVPLDELAPTTWQAFVASEDRRFMEHTGVDPQGILRALVVNLQSGGQSQGGSTLTQQLVKNLLVGTERSYRRKLREAVLALRLERELSKEQILELYLNFVYLGAGNYGVEAAARDYFNVSAAQLDPGQAAMLAGLVPAPARYSPRTHPDRALQRRRLVLGRMVEEGYIVQAEALAFEDDRVLTPREAASSHHPNAAYITQVRRDLRQLFGGSVPFEAGLQVYTPLDQQIQAVATQAVRQALVDLDKREGRRGPAATLREERFLRFQLQADGMRRDRVTHVVLSPRPGDCFPALVTETTPRPQLVASSFNWEFSDDECRERVRGTFDGRHAGALCSQLRRGDVVRVCLAEDRRLRLDSRPWGEGGAVVIENQTGRVLALVGGYDASLEGFVRATQARRQPGSSFKPYVYATALKRGRTQLDIVHDGPLSLPGGNGRIWSPQNYGGSYAGDLPMRQALAKSLNTVAVRLGMEVGPQAVVDTAHAMGVESPLRADLTVALGSSEVTPMDQALGYATIARMGVPVEPVLMDRLVDVNGREIGRAGSPLTLPGHPGLRLPGGDLPRALPAGVAYELVDMMREVVHAGTARKAWRVDMDRAGKTGTTNDCIDAWFVGFTPRYTVAVWIGSDGPASLGDRETGGKAALPAWITIVEALDQPAGERFPVPDEAILLESPLGWVGLPRGQVPPGLLEQGVADPDLPLPAP